MMLSSQLTNLLGAQACHGENANLRLRQFVQSKLLVASDQETYIIENMSPSFRRASLPKTLHQFRPHRSHTLAHMCEISKPLRCQLFIFKNSRNDPGAVDGRSRYLSARKPREHAESPRLRGFRSAHNVESTHSLTIQTKVLREDLCDEDIQRRMALEVSDGPCVAG